MPCRIAAVTSAAIRVGSGIWKTGRRLQVAQQARRYLDLFTGWRWVDRQREAGERVDVGGSV